VGAPSVESARHESSALEEHAADANADLGDWKGSLENGQAGIDAVGQEIRTADRSRPSEMDELESLLDEIADDIDLNWQSSDATQALFRRF